MTLQDLLLDGPPVRLRDLQAITGLSRSTLRKDVAFGQLRASKRPGVAGNASLLVHRDEARRYLAQLGFPVFATARDTTRYATV